MRIYTIDISCTEQAGNELKAVFPHHEDIQGGVRILTCRLSFLRLFQNHPMSSDGWASAGISNFGSEADLDDVRKTLEGFGLQTFSNGGTLDVFAI